MPLEKLGTRVFPGMFSLAVAHKAFAPEGHLLDETLKKRLEENVLDFMETVAASKNYREVRKYLQEAASV